MDPRILRNKDNILALEDVWRRRDKGITDLRRCFAFAYERMRNKYTTMQALHEPEDLYKAMLHNELQALTFELEFVEDDEMILEWEALKSSLFNLECEEETLWQRRSRSKWSVDGNEPSLFFFGLWEEQLRRE